jgi:N-acylneuraminate cytidylyltransferase
MNCLAIIPARGGSKGVPRKNIRLLAGHPLLSYSIAHARATPEINRIVVSTDDPMIARVAHECGAESIVRPAEISGDTATSESALLHTLDHLRDTEGYEPDLVVFLQATSPLRRADDISMAIRTLLDDEADSLFSACPMHGFVWRRDRAGSDWRSETYDYRNRRRRQDAPEDVVENGSIYVFRPRVLRELGNRLGGKIAVHFMDAAESVQVDTPSDLELVEHLLSRRRAPASAAELGRVRLLALDFDGVLTDNRVTVSQSGDEAVACHRGDGWGIARLREAGVPVVVISTETNPVVAARCRKLGIDCTDACDDKVAALTSIAATLGVGANEVAYVGNDVNDLACLRWVGLPIAVADAEPEVRAAARLVTTRPGGYGAVREVADWILTTRTRRDAMSQDAPASIRGGVR